MKSWILVILLSFPALLTKSEGLNPGPGIGEDIAAAIRSGNSVVLAKFFNATLELSVPGIENTMSKTQAEQIMKDFFVKNPVKSFKINHLGSSKDGSPYFIGTYVSAHNKSFRTFIQVKKIAEKYFIQQLQIELE
jgi:hypothetical protein